MRVIVWGINYAPEFTGIAPHNVALCEFLHARGDDVSMVTGFPYYPSWEKRPEDRGHLYRTDQINGVPVHRCWQFVPARVSALKRIFHEASFVFTSTLRACLFRAPMFMCSFLLHCCSASRDGSSAKSRARLLFFMSRICNRTPPSGSGC